VSVCVSIVPPLPLACCWMWMFLRYVFHFFTLFFFILLTRKVLFCFVFIHFLHAGAALGGVCK
jgi:hypothetical protein